MGILDVFRPVKATKLRDGLWSFGEDQWRLELGPKRVSVTIGSDVRASLMDCGAGLDYMKQMRDANGVMIKEGAEVTLHTWKGDRVWYLYKWEGGWNEVSTFDLPEQEALAQAKKLTR